MGLIQFPFQYVTVAPSLWLNWLGREADHSHLMPSLRMIGATHSFPHMPLWHE